MGLAGTPMRRGPHHASSPFAYLIVTWEQAPPGIVVLCRDSRQQICPQAMLYVSGFEQRQQAHRKGLLPGEPPAATEAMLAIYSWMSTRILRVRIYHNIRFPLRRCTRGIAMTPFRKVEMTLPPRILGPSHQPCRRRESLLSGSQGGSEGRPRPCNRVFAAATADLENDLQLSGQDIHRLARQAHARSAVRSLRSAPR